VVPAPGAAKGRGRRPRGRDGRERRQGSSELDPAARERRCSPQQRRRRTLLDASPRDRSHLAAVTLLAVGVILTFWRLHADNNDAALYTLIARGLARERTPFSLHYVGSSFQIVQFYEHPPLYFWIQAATLGLSPGLDLRLLGAMCGIATVATAYVLGRATVGARASAVGCTILVATEAFSNYQPLARLDPPLTLAFTASVTLLVLARGPRLLFLGGLVAGLGSLVKGPPALGAPVAAALLLAAQGRWDVLRRPGAWIAVAAGAVLPPLAFLAGDHLWLGGAWWDHYVLGQVVASAAGARRGHLGPFALLETNLWRFWPGLPFVALALVRAALNRWWPLEAPRAGRMRVALLAWAVLVFAGFAHSGRSFWWYLMPAYVPLALLAGAGVEDLLPRARAERLVDRGRLVVIGIGAALVLVLPFKVAARLERPCPFGGLPEAARAVASEGQLVAVVSPSLDYSTHVIFAEHCRCEATVVARLEEADRPFVAAALVSAGTAAGSAWRQVAANESWALLQRVR
jgi:4-amino-4-deoxy-L-arabinose transferase-like glycosyltransferase